MQNIGLHSFLIRVLLQLRLLTARISIWFRSCQLGRMLEPGDLKSFAVDQKIGNILSFGAPRKLFVPIPWV